MMKKESRICNKEAAKAIATGMNNVAFDIADSEREHWRVTNVNPTGAYTVHSRTVLLNNELAIDLTYGGN